VRIALIAPLVTTIREPQRGGSQAFLADLAIGLTHRGHEVDVYASTGSEIPGVTMIDTGIDSRQLATSLYRVGGADPTDSGRVESAFAAVFAAVRTVQYDIVHNHAFDAPAIRYAADVSAPVIHTLHLPPDMAVRSAVAEMLQSETPPVVAGVSASQARAWGVTTILSDGVPVDRIPWSGSAGEGLMFAGRFSPEKGAAEAIDIARRAGIRIDVYGDPYDPDYARTQIDPRRGLPGVAIHSSVPRAALWRLMGQAAAVLCPVKWEEPFGLVAAEAQAAGTPVIAFRRGAMEQVVVDGETGFLVPLGDLGAAARALGRLSTIRRAACRQHAETRLSLEFSLDAHDALYETVHRTASVTHA